MARVGLFIMTNIAVMIVIAVVTKIFGVDRWLTHRGINYQALLVFSLIVGFAGSIISLLISKFMAKMAYGIKIIDPEHPQNENERWLVNTVTTLAHDADISMPELGIYESPEVNAFATGASKRSSIVAVSSALLSQMNRRETQGVLAHEVSHIANGDMVTMTLLQGVLNTFVIFLSRVAGYFIDSAMSKGRDGENRGGVGVGYYISVFVCEIIFSVLASIVVMWFSRHREYRADASAAKLCGKQPMIEGLEKLKSIVEGRHFVDERAQSLSTFKISGKSSMMALFSTHPPLEKRIEALKQMY
jgi:heat shock protein HtpX